MHHICARVQMSILQDVPLSFYFLNFPLETYCVCGWFPLAIGYKTSFAHEGDHVDVTSCSEGCMCNITSYGNVELCRKTPPCFNILSSDLFGVYSCAKSGFNGKLYMNPRVLFQRTMIFMGVSVAESQFTPLLFPRQSFQDALEVGMGWIVTRWPSVSGMAWCFADVIHGYIMSDHIVPIIRSLTSGNVALSWIEGVSSCRTAFFVLLRRVARK